MNITITEELVKKIFKVIKESPYLRKELVEILMEYFPSRKETNMILEEIRKLREDLNKSIENFNQTIIKLHTLIDKRASTFEQEMAKMREDFNKQIIGLREDFNKQMTAFKREMAKMREDFNKQMIELREDFNKRIISLEKKVSRLEEHMCALGTRWGLFAEDSFRNALKGILKQIGLKVEKWEYYDEKGIVYGYPSVVDIDVIIHNGVHYLIEIKASIDKSDVGELYKLGKLYSKATGAKPILVIVSPYVHPRARKLAEKLKIQIFSTSEDVIKFFEK